MPPRVEPKHVAMFVNGHEVYGIGTVQRAYVTNWPDLRVICLGQGAMRDWLEERGARVHQVDGLSRFRQASSLTSIPRWFTNWRRAKRDAARIHQLMEGEDIRVLHAHALPQYLVSGHLRQLGYKTVWQVHNNMNRSRPFDFNRRLNHRLAAWGADLMLPVSDFIADNWRGCGANVAVVRNAAPRLFDSMPDPPPPPPLRCVIAGRLEASKGHHVAVEAVIKARSRGADVHLDLFGGPVDENPYADKLKRQVAASGADDAIRFRGFCDDLRQRHRDYHVGLQCRTDPEPCSVWICETLVDGLPLIASATGGTPELVVDGETGWLVPPSDPAALAERLLELANRPEAIDSARRAAYERGVTQFTTPRFIEESLAAYQSLFD